MQRHSATNLNLALVLTDFMTIARENDLAMPTDLAILFKALIAADGVMRQLDPKFDLFTAAGPTIQDNIQSRFSSSGFKKKLAGARHRSVSAPPPNCRPSCTSCSCA